MSAQLTPVLKQRFFDSNGDPLAGGKLYSYIAGTTTPLSTYTSQSGLVANANPVILDADGYADVWMLPTAYKFILKTALDVTIFTIDNVLSISQQMTSDTMYALTNGTLVAAPLVGETFNSVTGKSVLYMYQCIRADGTIQNGRFVAQWTGAAWRLVTDGYNGDDVGVGFTVTTGTTDGQLNYTLTSTGAGNASITFKKLYY